MATLFYRCFGCDKRREDEIAYCDRCEERTTAYFDDFRLSDHDRAVDDILAGIVRRAA